MKTKILLGILTVVLLLGISLIFINITKKTPTSYKNINYTELNDKRSMSDDFLLFVKKDGCVYCENAEPIINEIAKKSDLEVVAIISNREQEKNQMVDDLKIVAYPTLVLYKDGKEEQRLVGGVNQDELVQMIGGLRHATEKK